MYMYLWYIFMCIFKQSSWEILWRKHWCVCPCAPQCYSYGINQLTKHPFHPRSCCYPTSYYRVSQINLRPCVFISSLGRWKVGYQQYGRWWVSIGMWETSCFRLWAPLTVCHLLLFILPNFTQRSLTGLLCFQCLFFDVVLWLIIYYLRWSIYEAWTRDIFTFKSTQLLFEVISQSYYLESGFPAAVFISFII